MMPDLRKEKKRLSSFCARCGGMCCRGHHILVSGAEYRNLKRFKCFSDGFVDTPAGCRMMTIDALSEEKCPFLEEKGCVLEGKDRPLVCRMYPLTPVIEKKRIVFYLSSLCPYAVDVKGLSAWLTQTAAEAKEELSSWDRKELAFLGKRGRRAGEELVRCF